MKFIEGGSPRRKRKPKSTPLDSYEPYQKLRHMILGAKMKPYQQVGILFDSQDVEKLDMKWPWRTVADRIRSLIRDLGQEADYKVVKYETDTPGVWFVRVDYVPPVEADKRPPGGSTRAPAGKKHSKAI